MKCIYNAKVKMKMAKVKMFSCIIVLFFFFLLKLFVFNINDAMIPHNDALDLDLIKHVFTFK